MTDVPVPRCPDIVSFHFSLDRIFGDQYEFSGETHPFHELVYVLSGSIGVTAGEKVYGLDAGQCLIHPPNEFHRIWSEKGTEPHVLNLSFHASAMPEYAGRIRLVDIGFFEDRDWPSQRFIISESISGPLKELRPSISDKRSYGHAFVLAGSRQYPGAALMNVKAALRSGAGLVTAFVPETFAPQFAAAEPSAIWVGCPEDENGAIALE